MEFCKPPNKDYLLSNIAPLGNKVSTAIKCSVQAPHNYVCTRRNGGATPYLAKS